MVADIKKELRATARKHKVSDPQRFFKTGDGHYSAHDIFLGVPVPLSRIIAKKYSTISFSDIKILLDSSIHEERFVGLLILVDQYQKGDQAMQEKVFQFYIKNITRVNNWDLVDTSADKILGTHLFQAPKKMRTELATLATSSNLWERRIAIIATFYFIRKGEFAPTLNIAMRLMKDDHDLIHKAVGWMLREVGKRDLAILENFLQENKQYQKMPRTMLRYAIERFPEQKRKKYLLNTI